MNRRILLWCCR